MATEDRRLRERENRRRLITATARVLAEREGWDAVTTRRLATEIDFSQPVIYKHFASMEHLIDAVALQGFTELAETIKRARRRAGSQKAVGYAARAYLRWAVKNPILYDAMFSRPTGLRFADPSAAAPLKRAFSELRAAVESSSTDDADTRTEVLWAALHGLTTLTRGGRLRPDHARQRVDLLIASLTPA